MGAVVTVFGSARTPADSPEYALARAVGNELGRAGFTVCNGGFGGTMEASARGAREAGGTTIGVTFDSAGRAPNPYIDRVVRTGPLSDRLLKLVELGDAYVALQGGTGTLLELACVWEFVNKGIVPVRPIVVLGDFWNAVIETMREERMWDGTGDCTCCIKRVDSPAECAQVLTSMLR
jgi:uncharacterized protein (TIGR00725 family)